MADSTNTNPLIIDGTNTTARSIITADFVVTSIVVVGSANSWVVRLTDANNVYSVFRSTSAISGDRGGCYRIGPTQIKGIYANTLTNITEILIYGYSVA